MPAIRYDSRSIELSHEEFAAAREALEAFVRGVSMDPYLQKLPAPGAEFMNDVVKDLSMKAFGNGGPAGYTHRWRGLVRDFLSSLPEAGK